MDNKQHLIFESYTAKCMYATCYTLKHVAYIKLSEYMLNVHNSCYGKEYHNENEESFLFSATCNRTLEIGDL